MDYVVLGFQLKLRSATAASVGATPLSFRRRSKHRCNNRAQVSSVQLQCNHVCPPGKEISLFPPPSVQPIPGPSPRPHSVDPIPIPIPEEEEEETPFIAQYLISSFGLPRHRALKASTYSNLAPIKSSARPDSVIRFLKDTGLSDFQIKAAISFDPILLSCNVDKILKPRARELVEAGFTGEILVQFIRHNPRALTRKNAVSRLQFWREFVGNNDEALLKVIQKNQLLFSSNTERHVVPRLNLFREYGLSNQEIALLLTKSCGMIVRKLDCLRWVIEQTLELGLQPGSRRFLEGLRVVGCHNESSLNQKIEFFKKSYGWSQEDVCCAFRKLPATIAYSKENVKSHMDFLVREAMFHPESIASQPVLLGYSLERTLVPRHHILWILKEHGLKDYNLLNACVMSEKRFLEKYVVPFEKDVPGLVEAYVAVHSG